MTEPAIWLGDLARVMGRLRPTPTRMPEVLEFLGLAEPPPPLSVRLEPAPSVRATEPAPTPGPATTARSSAGDLARTATSSGRPEVVEETIVEPEGIAAASRPSVPPRPVPLLIDVLPPLPPPLLQPEPTSLLPPAQQRAVLTTLCSRPTPTGVPDLEALVDLLARRSPRSSPPRCGSSRRCSAGFGSS